MTDSARLLMALVRQLRALGVGRADGSVVGREERQPWHGVVVVAHPLLVAGITAGHLAPERAVEWMAAVHQALRESRGRVIGATIGPGPGRNYYLVRVQLGDGQPLRIMANLGVNLVAAADGRDPQTLVAAFRDVPRPDVFTVCGFSVALPADLDRPATDDQLSGLFEAERREVTYHRPPRIGDIIFNWFD